MKHACILILFAIGLTGFSFSQNNANGKQNTY